MWKVRSGTTVKFDSGLTWRRVTSGEQDAIPKATSRAKVMAGKPLQLVRSAQYTDSQCRPASSC